MQPLTLCGLKNIVQCNRFEFVLHLGLEILTTNSLGKSWVTSLNIGKLSISSGNVYSVLRSEGDPLTDSLVILGKGLKMTADTCADGRY